MTARPAVVGGFILGAFGLAVAAILLFGGVKLFASTARVVVFFTESVAGLDVGSPVTFHGVRIGSVREIGLQLSTDTMAAHIPVFLELDRSRISWQGEALGKSEADYRRLVQAGLHAQLAVQSMVTAQLRVDLDFRPDLPATLVGTIADVREIPSMPSELGQLRNVLTEIPLRDIADSVQRALVSLGRLSDHIDARLDPLMESVQRTSEAAAKTLQATDGAVRRMQGDASDALRDLDALVVDAHRQIDARSDELGRVLTASERTMRQAGTLAESLNDLADPRSEFRGDLDAATRDLAASASSLRGFAQTIERNPNALLLGRDNR